MHNRINSLLNEHKAKKRTAQQHSNSHSKYCPLYQESRRISLIRVRNYLLPNTLSLISWPFPSPPRPIEPLAIDIQNCILPLKRAKAKVRTGWGRSQSLSAPSTRTRNPNPNPNQRRESRMKSCNDFPKANPPRERSLVYKPRAKALRITICILSSTPPRSWVLIVCLRPSRLREPTASRPSLCKRAIVASKY
jgi:hypothetical protein